MDTNLDLSQYLIFIIPLIVIQVGLVTAALIHIFTHKHYRSGSRALWVVICLLLSTIGPILYFCLGRGEKHEADNEEANE